jgi:hypothetical protein
VNLCGLVSTFGLGVNQKYTIAANELGDLYKRGIGLTADARKRYGCIFWRPTKDLQRLKVILDAAIGTALELLLTLSRLFIGIGWRQIKAGPLLS